MFMWLINYSMLKNGVWVFMMLEFGGTSSLMWSYTVYCDLAYKVWLVGDMCCYLLHIWHLMYLFMLSYYIAKQLMH